MKQFSCLRPSQFYYSTFNSLYIVVEGTCIICSILAEFLYKGSYIKRLEILGENIQFDISDYFVKSEFDIEGVDCILIEAECRQNVII